MFIANITIMVIFKNSYKFIPNKFLIYILMKISALIIQLPRTSPKQVQNISL